MYNNFNFKKTLFYCLPFLAISFLFTKSALAICPICTIAVGAGVGFSRYLGIDDVVTGLWVGGLIVSMIAWTESWLEKKNIRFRGRVVVDALLYFCLVIIPLYYSGIIGNPLNALCFCGFDKLLFGIIVGAVTFFCGATWYFYLKEKNDGKVYFPFQKVALPVVPLIILSIIFYFLTK
ncbi:MAG: hypothetical protein WCX88_02270 [Patescibacteria group bacterium]